MKIMMIIIIIMTTISNMAYNQNSYRRYIFSSVFLNPQNVSDEICWVFIYFLIPQEWQIINIYLELILVHHYHDHHYNYYHDHDHNQQNTKSFWWIIERPSSQPLLSATQLHRVRVAPLLQCLNQLLHHYDIIWTNYTIVSINYRISINCWLVSINS